MICATCSNGLCHEYDCYELTTESDLTHTIKLRKSMKNIAHGFSRSPCEAIDGKAETWTRSAINYQSCVAALRIGPDSGASLPVQRSLVPLAHTPPHKDSCYGSTCTHCHDPKNRRRSKSTQILVRQETVLRRIGSTFEWTSSPAYRNVVAIFITDSRMLFRGTMHNITLGQASTLGLVVGCLTSTAHN